MDINFTIILHSSGPVKITKVLYVVQSLGNPLLHRKKNTYHLTAKFCTSPFLSSSNFKIIFTTFLSLSSSSLIESFCSSVIKSLVAINLAKDSQIIIARRKQGYLQCSRFKTLSSHRLISNKSHLTLDYCYLVCDASGIYFSYRIKRRKIIFKHNINF